MRDLARFSLANDGFMVVPGALSVERASAARELIVRVIEYAERGLEDPFSRYYLRHRPDQGALYDVLQRHPALFELARIPAVLDVIAAELGNDLFIYENSVVYKPPGKRNAVPFHQDFISRPTEPRKLIAWIALEPVTIATGAMKVLPGSHAHGFLPWHRVKGETHHDRIVPGALPDTKPIHVELDTGDALVFNQLLVHGSDEIDSPSLRVALRISYQGFEAINVPRGAPIVVRGGGPDALAARYPSPYLPAARPPIWRRVLRQLGRRLAAL